MAYAATASFLLAVLLLARGWRGPIRPARGAAQPELADQEISKSEPVRAALAKEGKGHSENIDLREFPALFRARASRAGAGANAVKPVLIPRGARTPSTRPHRTIATTTYPSTASRNRRRSSLSVSSWSNAPSTPMSTSTITKIRTIKQQYLFRISF